MSKIELFFLKAYLGTSNWRFRTIDSYWVALRWQDSYRFEENIWRWAFTWI